MRLLLSKFSDHPEFCKDMGTFLFASSEGKNGTVELRQTNMSVFLKCLFATQRISRVVFRGFGWLP